jgi:hypothetical protein
MNDEIRIRIADEGLKIDEPTLEGLIKQARKIQADVNWIFEGDAEFPPLSEAEEQEGIMRMVLEFARAEHAWNLQCLKDLGESAGTPKTLVVRRKPRRRRKPSERPKEPRRSVTVRTRGEARSEAILRARLPDPDPEES